MGQIVWADRNGDYVGSVGDPAVAGGAGMALQTADARQGPGFTAYLSKFSRTSRVSY